MVKPKLPWLKMVVYFPFCLVNVAVGLFFLFLPPVGLLIGIPMLVLACWPYATWLSKHIHAGVAYADRDQGLLDEEEVPWEQASELSEDEIMDIIINQSGRGRNE